MSNQSYQISEVFKNANQEPKQLPTFCVTFNILGVLILFGGIITACSLLPDPSMINPPSAMYMTSIIIFISSIISSLMFFAISSIIRRLQLMEELFLLSISNNK
jgi:hypothetical protein